jgi:hypothetical protein
MHGKMPMLYRNSPSSAADTPGRIPLGGAVLPSQAVVLNLLTAQERRFSM